MRRLSAAAVAASLIGFAAASAPAASATPQSEAKATIEQVESKKSDAAIAAEPIANAKKALERSTSARAASDPTTATLLARAAREWAALALSLLRAVEAEHRAETLEKRVAETETRSVRGRALLEETVARRGRAQQELDRLEGGSGKPGPEGKQP